MSHKSVRLLIENTVKSLHDDIQYLYAKPTDFNSVSSTIRNIFVNVDAMDATPQFGENGVTYFKTWNVDMGWYMKDEIASTPDQYQAILDEVDSLIDKFINKINLYAVDSDNLLIQSIRQEPFVKVMAAVITGYVVRFELLVTDNFDYCAIDC